MTCPDVADLLQVLVLQYGRYWIRTSDPLLVEHGKEEVKFFGLVLTVLVCLGLRPEWGVWFTPCFGLF